MTQPRRGHHKRNGQPPGAAPLGPPSTPEGGHDPQRVWRGQSPESRLVQLPATLPPTPVPIATYLRLSELLAVAIAAGVFTRGDALPRQDALARRYYCSQPTVRAAIAHLVKTGVLYRLPGGRAVVK